MASTPDVPLQSRVVDDKSPVCIPFILTQLDAHRKRHPDRPFVVGLNGVQGVGKTTLVRALAETLQNRQGLPTLVVSIDDFYLTHAEQLALAAAHPDNALVQYRGEPGTHDIHLLTTFLSSLLSSPPPESAIHVPQYDKAAFSGLGDRLPASLWPAIPRPPACLIVEGWCVGFRSLPAAVVEAAWRSPSARTLHRHKLDHLLFVNDALRAYDVLTNALDAFVHVDAEDISYVYEWRLEQEAQLRRERGMGMTDEQVVAFVDAYYPAYELYEDGVRAGVFAELGGMEGRQLRLVVGRDRGVVEKVVI